MKLFPHFFLAIGFSFAAFAVEPEAAPREFIHRVTGLFAPDREADLRAALGKVPGVTVVSVDFAHAEVALSYDPATAFKGIKPEKIVERLDSEVRSASNSTLGIQPRIPLPHDRHPLMTVEVPVVGLDCKACCLAAYEAIFKIDGVAQATASFREGRVTALIDPVKTNQAALEEALKKRNVQLRPAAK